RSSTDARCRLWFAVSGSHPAGNAWGPRQRPKRSPNGRTIPGRLLTHPPNSSPRCEPLLDLVHQRVSKPRVSHFAEIFEDNGLPRFPVLHLPTAIAKIECPRLLHAAQEHERMSAVRVEPYLVGRERDD